jgi:Fungal N-terminal domain of STAND proteins
MDPLSISTACVSLIATLGRILPQIVSFVSDVRDARRDMDAVSRELHSLSLSLENLRDDSTKIKYPEGSRRTLITVLGNCDHVTKEIEALLNKMASGNIGRRMQWTIYGRDDMNKLRSRLEAYKSAIDIALDMVSMQLISAVKDDTQDLKGDTKLSSRILPRYLRSDRIRQIFFNNWHLFVSKLRSWRDTTEDKGSFCRGSWMSLHLTRRLSRMEQI